MSKCGRRSGIRRRNHRRTTDKLPATRRGIEAAWNYKHRGQIEHAHANIDEGNSIILKGIQRLEEMGEADYIPEFRSALR